MFVCQGCLGDDQLAFDKRFNNFGRDMFVALVIDYDRPVSRSDIAPQSYCYSLCIVALLTGRIVKRFSCHLGYPPIVWVSSTSGCQAFATFVGTPSV